ncbi:MAG: EAL domain-containing protein, partial [Candidatus Neomarinimicrobiota bacterium]
KAHHTAQAAGAEMERRLNDAFENGEFILHYQPQMDVETQVIVGVEALIRWNDPEKGIISPSKFIPIAEETGLIIPLSKWVLREACLQNKKWQKMGFKPMRVGVNVSTQFLYAENLIGFIKKILTEVDLKPEYLEIEITESTIMTNDRKGITILKKLKDMGMGISIDDFGTGYSSLNYLKELPVTTLKIDQSFISSDMSKNRQIGNIVKTVIKLGHSLGLNVIAEGVETKKQLDYLKENYCNEIQGFLYSKPVEAQEITKMLRSFSSLK